MAPPPLIRLDGVRLTFGGTPLLTDIELNVLPGDRIALVGRNGSGKSTLLKIAAGQVEADGGEVFVKPGTTVRYLPQEPDFGAFESVGAYVESGLGPADEPYRVAMCLEALGLSEDMVPANLSGGEARRAALARAIAPEPDVLFLDEPTNHLDLPTIEWLEEEIRQMKSALVVISHDRRFLERVSRATVWLDRGFVRRLDESFSGFEAWRDKILKEEERDRHKLDRKIVREEHWLRYGVTARRTRNQRRLSELNEMRQQRREARSAPGQVRMQTSETRDSGKRVIEAEGITKAYGERTLIRDFDTVIARGDRVGLVGPNGAGKTTLLKILIGSLEPDSGWIKRGTNLDMAFLDQARAGLRDDLSVSHALTDGRSDQVMVNGEPRHVIGYLKDFLFTPEQARTPVGELSGGERARLILAKTLATPANLLVLDEPTNDLDMETLDLLQELIAGFDGTVLLVSHDRDFLDRTVTSVISPGEAGQWLDYAGGYSDMVTQKRRAARQAGDSQNGHAGGPAGGKGAAGGGAKPSPSRGAAGASGRSAAPAQGRGKSAGGKLSFKQKHALETLPREIERLEAAIAAAETEMADPDLFSARPQRFQALVDQLETDRAALARAEDDWLELEMARDAIEG